MRLGATGHQLYQRRPNDDDSIAAAYLHDVDDIDHDTATDHYCDASYDAAGYYNDSSNHDNNRASADSAPRARDRRLPGRALRRPGR